MTTWRLKLDTQIPIWLAILAAVLAVVVASADFGGKLFPSSQVPNGLERLNSTDDPIGIYLNTATGCEWSGQSIRSLSQHLDGNGKPICRAK